MDRQPYPRIGLYNIYVTESATILFNPEYLVLADTVCIEKLERLSYPRVVDLIKQLYEQMDVGCKLVFTTRNLLPIVQGYMSNRMVTEEVCEALFGSRRGSIWDELSMAELLLRTGFSKVKTDQSKDNPLDMVVSAIKV